MRFFCCEISGPHIGVAEGSALLGCAPGLGFIFPDISKEGSDLETLGI